MINLKSFLFLVASFIVAIFLIVYGPKWADRFGRNYDTAPKAQPSIGQISLMDGIATRRSYGHSRFLDFTTPADLQNLDTVQIQSRGKIELTLNNYKLLINGPGLLVLELWNNSDPSGPIVLHMISGQMHVLSEGLPGKLFVVRDGELTDAKGASVVRERSLLVTPLNIGEPPSAPILPTPTLSAANKAMATSNSADEDEDSKLLTNEYLDTQIAGQKDQFQRCQNNALREQGEVKGQILVGLTISPEGKISNARVLASTIDDDKLHTCVLQIFQRLKFKSFNGAPIVRSYPLNFE